ncbi:hypothetical protein MPSEU_001073800 [Mayamaea pseudoterrestris]|nr:hypothetical protein MPSEU_001073800 [Mayamaea pseudoterrestris]
MSSGKERILQKLTLYSDEAQVFVQQALEYAHAQEEASNQAFRNNQTRVILPRFLDLSDEEGDQTGRDDSESSSDDSDEEHVNSLSSNQTQNESIAAALAPEEVNISPSNQQMPRRQHRQEKPSMDAKQRNATITRHVENVSCVALPCNQSTALHAPSSLLSKIHRISNSQLVLAESVSNLANLLREQDKLILILCVRSGRFAGAVYQRDTCIVHTSSQRYTVRKGQGKAQSTQDGNRRPKSMGAQLRRAGEQLLKQDIQNTLTQWKHYIERSALILISCPKTMLKDLLDGDALVKSDERIRRVPLDVGRPTFEAVGIIHAVLMTVTLREALETEQQVCGVKRLNDTKTAIERALTSEQVVADETDVSEPDVPLSPLHIASRDGNFEGLTALLQSEQVVDWIGMCAGEFYMTPLHFAAQADASNSDSANESATVAHADCVHALLVIGHADPCALDGRHRVPWFLATTDKIREAFRRARATLGEDYCDWDSGAKVAAALTDDEIRRKQEIEAEKRRKKKARQKQKKAEDKAIEDARVQQQREEAERQKHEEEVKRIRDGLHPRVSTATNVCDFCQTSKKGMKRSDMFKRLNYVYCSTACVEKHKREIMAAAALKRLDGA